jgi:PmbA protein
MRQYMEKALSMAKGMTEQAEAIGHSGEVTTVEFKSGKLHSVEHKEIRGLGLRAIRRGRLGFSSTTDLARLRELVEHACQSAVFGQPARFQFPAKCRPAPASVFDRAVDAYSVDQAIAEGRQALERLRQAAPELKCDATIEKRTYRLELANSRGLHSGYDKTHFSYQLSGVAVVDGHLLFVGDGRRGCGLSLEAGAIIDKMSRLLKQSHRSSKAAGGRMPVLFSHEAMYLFWMALGLGVNGKMLQKRSSPLQGRLGEGVLDPRISVTDDPHLRQGSGSAPHDAEGVCTARLPLFQKGVFRHFIFDLQTAGIMGTASTGHGQRDFSSQPAPGISNLVISPGRRTLPEMIKSMDRGIIIHDLLGAGQSNLLAGDFSANIGLGFAVERGRIAGRVKDAMVAGNVYQMLRDGVGEVSREAERRGHYLTPAILFRDVSIAAK